MKRIGVSGSANHWTEEDARKARELGEEIAKRGCVIVTGACPGLPHEAAQAARKNGGKTIGISPAANLYEHLNKYKYPSAEFDEIFFTGMGWDIRNALFVSNCDAVIFIAGQTGTLQEFTTAYYMEKVIGVLEGTHGVSDAMAGIVEAIGESKFKPKIVFSPSPEELVEKVDALLRAGAKP